MKIVLIILLVSACVIGEEYTPATPDNTNTTDGDPRALRPVPTNGLSLDSELVTQLSVNALGTRSDDAEVVLDDATASKLSTPAGHQLLKYVATCALPADQELVVGTERFPGYYGLAPEWATGTCGTQCQQWVSACLLAHVNAKGQPFPISLRGAHPGLRTTPAAARDFNYREAAFYGNVFQRQAHACWATIGGDEQKLAGRVCGQLDGGCGFVITGACGGDPLTQACEKSAADGGFSSCHTGKFTEYPRNSPLINEVVTVYLRL
jgi:hypothetical protein